MTYKVLELQNIKRLLIRLPNWIGDSVMALGMLEDLHNAYPKIQLDVLALPHILEVVRYHPAISNSHSFEKSKKRLFHPIIKKLQHYKYDAGLLTTNSFSSAFWFYSAKIPFRIGFRSHFRSSLLNIALSLPKNKENEHLTTTYKRLLDPFNVSLSNTTPKIYISQEEDTWAKNTLHQLGCNEKYKIVGINPFAAYGSAKCWPLEHFEELIEKLLKDPSIFILVFGDSTSTELFKNSKSLHSNRLYNFTGKTTLRAFMALIKQCRVLLTNDSGPMHIADALEVPVCALFGSTNDTKTGPYRKNGIIIHKHVACSPCYLRKCPIDFRCMRNIQIHEVFQAIYQILGK